MIAAASVVGVAGADDITNDLDAVAEVMPLTVGGAQGSTQLYVVPRNGDGKNGCNLTGSTTLAVSVSSSNTAVATVSPSSITFTSCGDTPTLTVTPHSQGSATISLSQTSNNTGGTFNLEPARFTVEVAPPPNTAPTVTVAGVTGGGSYDKGSVPTATCNVTDAEDGNSTFAATLSAVTGPFASDGIGTQTASCSYTDAGGLTAVASETYGIVDPTPPEISHLLTPAAADGDNGWYRTDVALAWNVAEPQSPNSLQKTGCADQTITMDQSPTTYSCAATSAGGSAGPTTVTIKRDASPPTNVQFNSDVPADGGRYFPNNVPIGTGCTANDATSGLASCIVTGRSTAIGTHTLTATAKDLAGNTTTAIRTYSVRTLTVSGYFQPVDMGTTINTVKGGATVPLKFTVSDEGVEQTATSIVKSFLQRQVNCTTLSGLTDEIELVTTGGTSLRYDATARQFIQNWQTPKKPGTCFQATVTMIDDTAITANFQLK